MASTEDVVMAEVPPASSRSSSLSPLPSDVEDLEFELFPDAYSDRRPEPASRISPTTTKPSKSPSAPSPARDASSVDETLPNRDQSPKIKSTPSEDRLPRKPPSPVGEDISLENISISSPQIPDGMAPMRRSGRQPKASQKGLPAENKPTVTAKVIIKKSRGTRRKKWNAENLLTDVKSPLVDGDIRAMLSTPAAWEVLTQAERTEIIALLPAGTPILDAGTPEARPDMVSLASDDSFRHDCAMYAENLGDGKHDPQWLEDAWSAHDERAAGEYEEYLEQHFEEEWGVELPVEMKRSLDVPRDESSTSRELSVAANGSGDVNGKGRDWETNIPSNGADDEPAEEQKSVVTVTSFDERKPMEEHGPIEEQKTTEEQNMTMKQQSAEVEKFIEEAKPVEEERTMEEEGSVGAKTLVEETQPVDEIEA